MSRSSRAILAILVLGLAAACDPLAPLGVLSDEQKLDSITISPDSSNVRVGDSVQVTVTLVGKGGGTIGGTPVITLGNPLVVTLTASGWLRGVAVGRTEVLATYGNKRGAAVVRVVP